MSVPDSLLKALISEFQCASSTSTGGPCALLTASTLVYVSMTTFSVVQTCGKRGHLALWFKVSVDIDAGLSALKFALLHETSLFFQDWLAFTLPCFSCFQYAAAPAKQTQRSDVLTVWHHCPPCLRASSH